jgi:hypothetical protein
VAQKNPQLFLGRGKSLMKLFRSKPEYLHGIGCSPISSLAPTPMPSTGCRANAAVATSPTAC